MQTNKLRSKTQKLLIALPLFLLPIALIIYLLFSAFHPGKAKNEIATTTDAFNKKLPSPNLSKGEKNKLELYMEAQNDSLKKQQAMNRDPSYANRLYDPGPPEKGNLSYDSNRVLKYEGIAHTGHDNSHKPIIDPIEKKANDRLERLYAVLKQAGSADSIKKNASSLFPGMVNPENTTEKLESLIQSLHQKDTSTDPKMTQLSGMLDKIMAIQHPQSNAQTPANKSSNDRPVYNITTSPLQDPPSDWNNPDSIETAENRGNSFYGWSEEKDTSQRDNSTILAVIHDEQTVHSGASVKIRLLQDIYIGTTHIPKGNFITGYCSIDGERVKIQLTNINYNNQIFPIQLKVYDTDGLEGVSVPGTMSRDAAKEGLSQGVGAIGMTSLDPSLAGQATAATIETAKSLLSRKAKLIQATLKADHKILLRRA